MAPRPREIRTPDRAATERALQRATLDLLDRNGVLAGLNLREVADEAGVNRGLVYHYFGSRRDLLRAALRSDVGARMRDLREGTGRPMRERYASFFRTMLHHRRAVVLSALLVLDGDDRVRLDVDPEGRRGRFAREVANRELPSDVDGDAHWVALSSMIYGYSVFRRRFADEMGIDLAELDERVLGATDRLLAAVEREAQAEAASDAASAAG